MLLPRLLSVADEGAACRELESSGCDPARSGALAAGMIGRLIKVPAVPCGLAAILRREMLSLGGEAVVAHEAAGGHSSVTDVILIGSLHQFREFARRLTGPDLALVDLGSRLAELLDNLDRPPSILAGRTCRLRCDRPLIMGILNVTPDSFSDGGRFATVASAVDQGRRMVDEGADLIDVGGESTRPGASAVSVEEEMERVLPVLERLGQECGVPLSIDTHKSPVARAAIAAGAEFVNDISGFSLDPAMAECVAAGGAGAFLMHARGTPATMQQNTVYPDLLGEVMAFLAAALERAAAAGIPAEKLAVDPGIGFGKDAAGNLEILRRLPELLSLGRPILLGTSRKSFLGRILNQPDPAGRLSGTLATVALGVAGGARIFRVHEVGPARAAAMTAWAISGGLDQLMAG